MYDKVCFVTYLSCFPTIDVSPHEEQVNELVYFNIWVVVDEPLHATKMTITMYHSNDKYFITPATSSNISACYTPYLTIILG